MIDNNISSILKSCIEKIRDLNESIWWIHEDCLLDVLQVDYNGVSKKTCIHLLVKLLTKGKLNSNGINMKLEGISPLLNFDDLNLTNDLSFWYQVNRSDLMSDKSGIRSKRIRWFTKGPLTTLLTLQIKILKDIIGHDDSRSLSSSEIRKRRQSTYIDWYHGKRIATKSFKLHDLIPIAKRYPDIFISSDTYADTMKRCILYSNLIHSTQASTSVTLLSAASSSATSSSAMSSYVNCSLLRLPKNPLPSSLKVESLVGDKSLNAFIELGSIEYLLYNIRHYKKLPDKFDHPNSVDVSILQSLSPTLLNNASMNVRSARKKLLETTLDIFRPKDNEFLKNWIDDGKRWNQGERLPVKLYSKHETSHHDCLTDESASLIRHILFTHKVKSSKFPSLMNEFSALLLGRPLRLNEFPSRHTIERRMLRLDIIDWEFFVQFFKERINIRDKYGFRQLWYMVMDDFYHLSLKQQRHIIFISAEDNDGSPCFKVLSTTSSMNKTASGNHLRDIQILTQKLPASILSGLGGSMSDNEPAVMLESNLTFNGIMNFVEEKIENEIRTLGSSDIFSPIENNVRR